MKRICITIGEIYQMLREVDETKDIDKQIKELIEIEKKSDGWKYGNCDRRGYTYYDYPSPQKAFQYLMSLLYKHLNPRIFMDIDWDIEINEMAVKVGLGMEVD